MKATGVAQERGTCSSPCSSHSGQLLNKGNGFALGKEVSKQIHLLDEDSDIFY